MTAPHNGLSRVCPTRIDGAAALFAHRVTQAQCQGRQRGRYHKCYTCAYNNTYVALNGLPGVEAPKPAEPPARRKNTGPRAIVAG
jgi:hypothetical protein